MSQVRPNFFILGAPKCGTTSMAAWLGEHPDIFMSNPKEPWFFNEDIGGQGVRHLAAYERLFAGALEQHEAVGEASTVYLRSEVAVPRILQYVPDARFIVMVRNPCAMAISLHGQEVFSLNEDIPDFAAAWHAQQERAAGRLIPRRCRDPQLLLYGDACRVGEQVERLYQRVDPDRVHLIFLEDMQLDPASSYRRTLAFLQIADDDRNDFPVANARKRSRHFLLKRALKSLQHAKERLGWTGSTGLLAKIHRWNQVEAGPPAVTPDVYQELVEYFRQDIRKLAALTGRDLSHWLE